MIYRFTKRVIDLSVAVVSLLLASPVLLVVALLLRIYQGKVLFRQQRPGQGGKPFLLYKFCSMNEKLDANGALLPDAERLTAIGSKVRSSSLDELPQLFNVLKGEMSLVGPRPLLMQYLPRYSKEQFRRHEAKPGITGWAQINGRNALSWAEKFKLDVWYVDHASLWLDLRIIAMTFGRVLNRSGISKEGHVTMHEFMGNDADGQ